MALGSSVIVSTVVLRMQNQLSSQLRQVQTDFAASADAVGTQGAKINAALGGLSMFATRVGLLGGIVGAFSVSAASAFDKAGSHVAAFTNVGGQHLAQAQAQFEQWAVQYGLSATKVEQAFYQVASAGISYRDSMKITQLSVEAAAASQSDLTAVLQSNTALYEQYHSKNMSIKAIVDEVTTAVKLGRMEYDELARSVASATAVAPNFNISFAQVAAILDVLTNKGVPARQAAMDITATIRAMANPTTTAARAAMSLGVSWTDLYGKLKGGNLIGLMIELDDAMKRHHVTETELAQATNLHGQRLALLADRLKLPYGAMVQLSGGAIALNTILRTVGTDGGQMVVQYLQQIQNSSGATDQAFQMVSDHAYMAANRLKAALGDVAINIGSALLPPLAAIAQALVPITMAVARFAAAFPHLTEVVIAASAALLALGLGIRAGMAVWQIWQHGIEGLSIALQALGLRQRELEGTAAVEAAAHVKTAGAIDLQTAAALRLRLEQERSMAGLAGDEARLAGLDEQLGRLSTAMDEAALGQAKVTTAAEQRSQAEAALTDAVRTQQAAEEHRLVLDQELAAAEEVAATRLGDVAVANHQVVLAQDGLTAATDRQRLAREALDATSVRLGTTEESLLRRSSIYRAQQLELAAATTGVADAEGVLAGKSTAAAAQVTVLEAAQGRLRGTEKELAATNVILADSQGTIAKRQEESAAAQTAFAAAQARGSASLVNLGTAAKGAAGLLVGVGTALLDVVGTVVSFLSGIAEIIIIVAALAAGFLLAYNNVKWFHDAVDTAMREAGTFITGLMSKVAGLVNELGNLKTFLVGVVGEAFAFLGKTIVDVAGWFGHLNDMLSTTGDSGNRAKGVVTGLAGAFHNLTTQVTGSTFVLGGLMKLLGMTGDTLGKVGHQLDIHASGLSADQKAMADYERQYKSQLSSIDAWAEAQAALQEAVRKQADALRKNQGALASLQQQALAILRQSDETVTNSFSTMATGSIAQTNRMAAGVLASLTGMATRMEATIRGMTLPALVVPVAYGQVTAPKFQAPPDTAGAAATGTPLPTKVSQDLAALTHAMATMPEDFHAAMVAVIAEHVTKLRAVHDTLLAGLKAETGDWVQRLKDENTRHAGVLKADWQTYTERLKTLDDTAAQKRQALDAQYQQKLQSINEANQRALETWMQRFQMALEGAGQRYAAAIDAAHARLDQIQQAHDTRQQQLATNFQDFLQKHRGTADALVRQQALEKYRQDTALNNQRTAQEKGVVDDQIIRLSTTQQQDVKNRVQAGQQWLSQHQAQTTAALARADAGYRSHAAQVQQALNVGSHTAHDNYEKSIGHEATVHQQHVTGIDRAHTRHIQALEKLYGKQAVGTVKDIKDLSGPGTYDALHTQLQNQVDADLKRYALAVSTGTGNLDKLRAQLDKDSASLARLDKGMADAKKAQDLFVASTVTGAEKFSKSLQKATDQVQTDIGEIARLYQQGAERAPALGAQQRKLLAGEEGVPRYTQLDAAMQKVADDYVRQSRLDQDNLKAQTRGAEITGQWSTVMENRMKSSDQTLKDATAGMAVALHDGQTDVSGFAAQMDNAASRQEQWLQSQDAATRRQQVSQILAAQNAGDLARTFDLTSQLIKSDLSRALSTAAQEIVDYGGVSAATAGKIVQATAADVQQTIAQTQAERIQTEATLRAAQGARDLSAAFDIGKSAAAKKLTDYMSGLAEQYRRGIPITAQQIDTARRLKGDSDAYDVSLQRVTAAVGGLSDLFDLVKKTVTDNATQAQNAYAYALYQVSQGASAASVNLDQLRQRAIDAAVASKGLAESETAAKKATDEATMSTAERFNADLQAARASYEDALASLAAAKAKGVEASVIASLTQQAVDLGVKFQQMQDTIDSVTKDIGDTVSSMLGDDTAGTSGDVTPYQSFEEGIQQQRVDLTAQKQTAQQQLDAQKLQLQEQKQTNQLLKSGNAAAGKSSSTTNQLLADALQEQQALSDILAKTLLLNAIGLQRMAVSDLGGNMLQYLNSFMSQSRATISVPS